MLANIRKFVDFHFLLHRGEPFQFGVQHVGHVGGTGAAAGWIGGCGRGGRRGSCCWRLRFERRRAVLFLHPLRPILLHPLQHGNSLSRTRRRRRRRRLHLLPRLFRVLLRHPTEILHGRPIQINLRHRSPMILQVRLNVPLKLRCRGTPRHRRQILYHFP
uniref:(northern house mosquito) hypothetical protein n=1 Tax=Culex pipiens TaxID=7175 RepID=A0A8D8BN35_CULPI